MKPFQDQITFAILAGGDSTRMGRDKAFLPFSGRPLIHWILLRGQSMTDDLCVIANRPEAYQDLHVPIVPDKIDLKGPLVGLYTALSVSEKPYLILVGCDMPFINLALLSYQIGVLDRGLDDVVIPKHVNGLEPLHAVYRQSTCIEPVRTALQEGERSLVGWLKRVKVHEVPDSILRSFDPELKAFVNLNTPKDYDDVQMKT